MPNEKSKPTASPPHASHKGAQGVTHESRAPERGARSTTQFHPRIDASPVRDARPGTAGR